MGEITETKTARRVVIDVRLRCEAPPYVGRLSRTVVERERELQSWISDFTAFLHDHRSQDLLNLSIEREWGCSECGGDWETMEDEDGVYCAHCGAPLAEQVAKLAGKGE